MPGAADPHPADGPRYAEMARRFGRTTDEQLTCGCHVHVAVTSEDEAVGVVDRVQPWLAVLLALSVNSPFWAAADTGYCSYRSQVQVRWPSAGPTDPFGSAADYRRITEELLRTETLLDRGMLYFDARPSHHHPTVEVRVGDVCRDPRDTLLLAALTRGLVETAAREWASERPVAPVRIEMLRLASWRAGRSGIDDTLLLPHDWRPAPAGVVVDALIDHVAPALTDAGDLVAVRGLWHDLRRRRPGAHHQRHAYREGGLAVSCATPSPRRRTSSTTRQRSSDVVLHGPEEREQRRRDLAGRFLGHVVPGLDAVPAPQVLGPVRQMRSGSP